MSMIFAKILKGIGYLLYMAAFMSIVSWRANPGATTFSTFFVSAIVGVILGSVGYCFCICGFAIEQGSLDTEAKRTVARLMEKHDREELADVKSVDE